MTFLLKDSQMKEIQFHAQAGMKTPVTIKRSVVTSNELGDDNVGSLETVVETRCWLHSTPTAEPTLDGGIVTANTYRMNLPVGTDVLPRDHVFINDTEYVVTDTTADETWPAMLNCSLRLRE